MSEERTQLNAFTGEEAMQTIGIYADPEYRDYDKIKEVLTKRLGRKTLITLPVMSDLDVKIRNFILTNTDLPIRDWQPDPVEEDRLPPHQLELLSDHMFISYLKFFPHSTLYIFAREHHVIKNSFSYSERVQSMIINAHLSKLKYEVIREDLK